MQMRTGATCGARIPIRAGASNIVWFTAKHGKIEPRQSGFESAMFKPGKDYEMNWIQTITLRSLARSRDLEN